MKEKVEIILRSVQRNEEEENETELRTEGVYEHDGKNWSVSYEESEATGFEDSTTEITGTDGRCVSIVRRGSADPGSLPCSERILPERWYPYHQHCQYRSGSDRS